MTADAEDDAVEADADEADEAEAAEAEADVEAEGEEPAVAVGEGDGDERVFVRARTPELPEDADISILDPEVKQELRGLPKGLAEIVGRHLAAAGMLIDSEPESALEHARYARSKAARVAVVREAAGLAAYHAGEWAEALSELRAARRMSHGTGHLAVMADCERALGRPERAIELAREAQGAALSPDEAVELRIVAAGARRDMGQLDAAVVALQGDDLDEKRRDPWSARLFYAYADNLEAAGRTEEAVKWFLNAAQADDDNETDAAERAFDLSPQD
ncbi:tetratricopeptide repeat protein [Saccharothrix saharensis]|uniref:Tetratricopeptide repeat protein n=1 Tax=Saccharothrix saharensis TaxID=571190 RepID=A0A543JM43_9PSEU|nr:tetratricopeptide repeat protein [Saccharothrix saharensis]